MCRPTPSCLSFAVAVALLLATGCDRPSEASSESSPTEPQPSQTEPSGFTAHQTKIGLRFSAPEEWGAKLTPPAAFLDPPGHLPGKKKDDVLLALRFAPSDVEEATDEQYLDEMSKQFTDRISGATLVKKQRGLKTKAGPGSYIAWDVTGEWDVTKRVGFLMAFDQPWMFVLRASSTVDRMKTLREPLKEIFSTVDLATPELDPEAVGTWKRVEPAKIKGKRYDQKLTLGDDGSFRLLSKRAYTSTDDEIVSVGRWAIDNGKMMQYVGNQLRGGIKMQTIEYELTGEGEVMAHGSGSSRANWRRLAETGKRN